MPYIMGNELCERLASAGLALNFISYLMGEYHMNQVAAATLISIVTGTSSLTPLIGAFLSDAYLGRFWTIILSSFSNLIGSVLLCVTAVSSSLKPADKQHATPGQFALLCTALVFIVTAAGGIRPCTYAFGADQFQQDSQEGKKTTQSFFNWYFFFMYTANLLGATVLVYVQDNAGWVWGFGVPSISIIVATILILVGRPLYRHVPPTGSPFTGFAQVIIAAFYKRNLLLPSCSNKLHEAQEDPCKRRLPHTNRLKFLDHAAIETEDDFDENGRVKNCWRLSTLTQLEELKALIGLGPIWMINMLSTTVLSQHVSFTIPQAKTMDRHMGRSFQIPAASIHVFATITFMLWVPLYDKILVPKACRLTGHPRGLKLLQRIGIGFFISVVGLTVSGLVETKRRDVARHAGFIDKPHRPIPFSIFWLVPQFCIYGLAEAFHSIGQLEFLYDQLPDNMRSMAGAVFWCSVGIGHYAGTIILQLVHKFTGSLGHQDWLGNNLNRGHLDYYYYLLAILQFVNSIMFLMISRRYTYKCFDDERQIDLRGKAVEMSVSTEGICNADSSV